MVSTRSAKKAADEAMKSEKENTSNANTDSKLPSSSTMRLQHSTSKPADTKKNAVGKRSLPREDSQRLKLTMPSTDKSPLTDSLKAEAPRAVQQGCYCPLSSIPKPIGNWQGKPWQQWDKYDCLQWIQIDMPYQSQLNALRTNEVDGKKLEELIQFDMECRRAQRFQSSAFPKSPMAGVTWTGVRVLSDRFWPMVTDHLTDINTD